MTPRIVTVPAGQRRASGDEVATVQVFNQLDDIATHAGLAAIPHALLELPRPTTPMVEKSRDVVASGAVLLVIGRILPRGL